ncbi:hypothetical protein [Microbacterium sp.]|uniref:hypothetical protein n=1 Tax=Microbacterium sp. TaxID=51671 RepID=UPI0039E65E7D
MGTVHFVTVGLSIFQTLKDERDDGPLGSGFAFNVLSHGIRQGAVEVTAKKDPSKGVPTYAAGWGYDGDRAHNNEQSRTATDLKKLLAEIESEDLYDSGLRRVSAELDSLGAHLTPHDLESMPRVGPSDVTVFLVSDTDACKAAAFWNVGLLTKGTFRNVHWIDDGFTTQRDLDAGHIYIGTVRDLEAGSLPRFAQDLGRLAVQMHGDMSRSRHTKAVFHLSGGYKAAVPYFLAMAEWLEYPESQRLKVAAYAMHEDDRKKVSLPVRRIAAEGDEKTYVRWLYPVVGEARSGPEPYLPDVKDRRLDGYAYRSRMSAAGEEKIDDTDLGWGLSALLSFFQ